MRIDQITLEDLSFLGKEHSVFSMLKDECTTQEGVLVLKQHVLHPPKTRAAALRYQDGVRFWMQHRDKWTRHISNGTLVMVKNFFETTDGVIAKPTGLHLFVTEIKEKLSKKKSHSFERFSISHLSDFMKGCAHLTQLQTENPPAIIAELTSAIAETINQPLIQQIIQTGAHTTTKEWLVLSYESRRTLRSRVFKLTELFAQLDALQALAAASARHHWQVPEILPAENLTFEAKNLVHPLLKRPVGYDLRMDSEKRFMFLTGANMSGKSTLLYAMGIAALLAHLGCGVPAEKMKISFLNGMISNMHIEDNIVLGESYFYAEVQRMKETAKKLNEDDYQLVLMDELFKGTNGQDAYDCTFAVVKGLLKKDKNMMALSTHLSELSEKLKDYPEITFRFCRTLVDEKGHYQFTYQLEEGVSNNRIGFLVLKNEGVLKLLPE